MDVVPKVHRFTKSTWNTVLFLSDVICYDVFCRFTDSPAQCTL